MQGLLEHKSWLRTPTRGSTMVTRDEVKEQKPCPPELEWLDWNGKNANTSTRSMGQRPATNDQDDGVLH